MKRSDIVRTIQVQFKRMRGTDAAAVIDTVADTMMDADRKSTRLNSSHLPPSRMPSSA